MNPLNDVERARRWLRRRPASSRAVHEARKSLKRARAVLKLGRGSAVEAESARAGSACRRAARALAPLRDEHVLAATLDDILARGARELPRAARIFGRGLAARARRAEARALARGAALRRAKAALRACPPGLGRAFARPAPAQLERGLRESYRRGRRDYRRARSDPRKGRFHALRKDSKSLLHELEALAPRAGAISDLRGLTKVLGDEHDLSMLRARLARAPDGEERSALRRFARRRQRRLRRRALAFAGKLYSGRGRSVATI